MIYTVIMFHDSIPHSHSDPVLSSEAHQKEHVHHHSHHSHHDHDHHHADSKNEPSILNRLLGALGDHHNALEIDHFDDDISIKTNSENGFVFVSINDIIEPSILQGTVKYTICSSKEKSIFESPPLLYEHTQCSSASLRGPPQLS